MLNQKIKMLADNELLELIYYAESLPNANIELLSKLQNELNAR